MKKMHLYNRFALALGITAIAGLLLSAFALNPRTKAALSKLAGAKRTLTGRSFRARPAARTDAAAHNVALAHARVSSEKNDIIVVMDATGDLPGALTLKLNCDGARVTGGEWALVVAYTELLFDQPTEDGDPGEALVQKGTLKGTITSAQITLGPTGSITGIDSLQLLVNGGSLTFESVTEGSGFVQSANLQDTHISSGSLNLNF